MGKGYQPLDMHNCTTYNKKYREQNNTTEIPMPRTLILSILLLLFLFPLNSSADCVITMTYKDGGKPPLIAAMPDNNGAYIDLFTKAADKIGCSLNLVRHPKKRLHKMLAQGKLDFYPGASFSKKRNHPFCTAKRGSSHNVMTDSAVPGSISGRVAFSILRPMGWRKMGVILPHSRSPAS